MNLLETELGELKGDLLDMTVLVKEQLDKSITAFFTFDKDLAKEVISKMLRGKAAIIPGFWNRFIYGVSKLTPNFLQNMLVRRAFKRISAHKY